VLYIKAGTTNMAGAWFIHRPVRPVRGLYGPCGMECAARRWLAVTSHHVTASIPHFTARWHY